MTTHYKAAAELRAGDRIPPGWLPGVTGAAEIVYVRRYTRRDDWVFTVYVEPDGLPGAYAFLADAQIPVEPPLPVPDGVWGESEGAGPNRHTPTGDPA